MCRPRSRCLVVKGLGKGGKEMKIRYVFILLIIIVLALFKKKWLIKLSAHVFVCLFPICTLGMREESEGEGEGEGAGGRERCN